MQRIMDQEREDLDIVRLPGAGKEGTRCVSYYYRKTRQDKFLDFVYCPLLFATVGSG